MSLKGPCWGCAATLFKHYCRLWFAIVCSSACASRYTEGALLDLCKCTQRLQGHTHRRDTSLFLEHTRYLVDWLVRLVVLAFEVCQVEVASRATAPQRWL